MMIVLSYLAIILIHGSIHDYQPEDQMELKSDQEAGLATIRDSVLSFITWNTGYGGLGAQSDFFYQGGAAYFWSGGKMVRPPESQVNQYIEGALRFIRTYPADFYLFQEVDYSSNRSYLKNQFQAYLLQLPNYEAYYAQNLVVARIPAPILQPWKAYGKTDSGLASFSKYKASKAIRYQLPGNFGWPDRIFLLDRCVALTRHPVKNGKELVVMNIHNSAYDEDGSLRSQQMDFLKALALKEFEQGNYVVLGGDWNQCPPGFAYDSFLPQKAAKYPHINIEKDFFPKDWQWVYDPTFPTNRKSDETYRKGKTFVTLIDFYLLSPNLEAKEVKTINQDFQFSDHQPVFLELKLL